jgi:hypothetical protein
LRDLFQLAFGSYLVHCAGMRAFSLWTLLAAACWAEGPFGTWKMNPARSKIIDDTAKTLTVRFEPHAKGEVFTLDSVGGDGRATTSSTILYFDDKPRDFQNFECSGTQSSRRVDSRTVEILRKCDSSKWTRFVRRLGILPNELILDITEQHPDGRRLERRLVLEKQ